MIQRVQSLFLLAAAVAMITMLFFPVWQKVSEDRSEMAILDTYSMDYVSLDESGEMTVMASKNTFYLAGLAVLSALVALFSIFQYTNRLLQIKLGALNSFLLAVTLFLMLYYILRSEGVLSPTLQGTYLFGFYLPVVALFCNMMANRFIRRDEQLVRSADRIR